MLTRKRLLTVVFLMGFFSGPVRAEPLHVYLGEGQMPYADFHEKPRGLFGELMVALCDRLQLDCQFRSVPWLRVQQLVAQDARGVLLNLGRTEERERQFAWLLPVVRLPYVLHGLTRPLDSLEQALAAGPVAVMAGTPRARQLASVRQGDQMVVEVTDPKWDDERALDRLGVDSGVVQLMLIETGTRYMVDTATIRARGGLLTLYDAKPEELLGDPLREYARNLLGVSR